MDRYVATTDLLSGWARAHGPGLLPETVTAETIERNGWTESVKKISVTDKDTHEDIAKKVDGVFAKADVAAPPATGGAPVAS